MKTRVLSGAGRVDPAVAHRRNLNLILPAPSNNWTWLWKY